MPLPLLLAGIAVIGFAALNSGGDDEEPVIEPIPDQSADPSVSDSSVVTDPQPTIEDEPTGLVLPNVKEA